MSDRPVSQPGRTKIRERVESAFKRFLARRFAVSAIALLVAFLAYMAFTRWPVLWSATGPRLLTLLVWIIGATAGIVAVFALVEQWYSKEKANFFTLAALAGILTAMSRLLTPVPHVTSADFEGIRVLAGMTLDPNVDAHPRDIRIARGIELSQVDPAKLAEGKIVLGKLSEAVSLFDQSIAESTRDVADGHFYKARALWAMAQSDKTLYVNALEEANLSLDVRPMYSPALVIRCIALRQLGRLEDALRVCDDAVVADKSSESARNAQGATKIAMGDHEGILGGHYYVDALADLDIGIHLRGDVPQLWSNKALALHRLKRDREALDAVETALHYAPDFSDALLNKGTILKRLGRYPEAIRIYQKLTEKNPLDAEAWNNLGDAAENNHDLDQALEAFSVSLQINPKQPVALFNKGEVLNELCTSPTSCRASEAVEALEGARSAIHNDPEVDYELAFALYSAGKSDEALPIVSEAVRLSPHYGPASSLRDAIRNHSKATLDTTLPPA